MTPIFSVADSATWPLVMPIEQGNSGGPLIDRRGRAQGILTMKSVVTENLGFAVGINALQPLLKKPNPVPIAPETAFQDMANT